MGPVGPADIFLLERFRFDRRSGGLFYRDSGAPVLIGSRALGVLGVLLGRAGDVVSKDEIMSAVWPNTVVEDGNLTVQISALRRVLVNEKSDSRAILTVPGRGYRFVGAITGHDPGSRHSLGPLPGKPSIAVLPFDNMSGDPEQQYFVDGMVEEIITALSRIRWLFVIARNSSFSYRGQTVDVKQVGRELGVRYVLEGSVRKAGQRVRITGQLIDATTGTHLWADRFDGSLEDVFELQDKVAISVAGVIEPTLQTAEIRRSSARPTSDLTAYDFYLRALPHQFPFASDRNTLVLDLLGRAIARDPHYGPALALAAFLRAQLDVNGWTDDREVNRLTAIDLARRALLATPDDPEVLAPSAFVLAWYGEDIDVAIGLVDRCLDLNPSFARGWYWSAVLRLFAGQPDLAIKHFEASLRLSPRDRFGAPLTGIGIALFFSRRFDEAVAKLRMALEQLPTFALPYQFLASCFAHMGRIDEARDIVSQLRSLTPVVVPSGAQFRNPEQRELYLSGLRLAAGETT